MSDEETKQDSKQEIKQEEKPINPLLDQTRREVEKLLIAGKAAKEQADRLEQLQSNQLMGSSAGGRPEMPPKKEETNKEYAARVLRGQI